LKKKTKEHDKAQYHKKQIFEGNIAGENTQIRKNTT